jgi:hypothetical protein
VEVEKEPMVKAPCKHVQQRSSKVHQRESDVVIRHPGTRGALNDRLSDKN